MVDKKGFIRTLEAVIAILIILSFILYILPRKHVLAKSTIPEGVESSRNFILKEFLTNTEIRECVGGIIIDATSAVSDGEECLKSKCAGVIIPLLDKHVVPGFNYTCEICDNVAPCTDLPPETIEKSVYPGSVFMYFVGKDTKYVRVYFWRK